MTEELKKALSSLEKYLEETGENGYSAENAGEVLAFLKNTGDLEFGRIISVFGCSDFEIGALGLCLLAAVSGKAAKKVSELCGSARGSVTAGFAGALFFGTEDIAPFAAMLQPYSALSRLAYGVAPVFNASMRIREHILDYALSGSVFDEAFCPEDKYPEVTELASQKRTIAEITSFIKRSDRTEPFVLQITGEKGTGRRTCARIALSELGIPWLPVNINENITRERVTELADKYILSGSIPTVITGSSETVSGIIEELADEVGLVIQVCEPSVRSRFSSVESAVIGLDLPNMQEQLLLWNNESRMYRLRNQPDFSELTGEFDMPPGAIRKAMRFADVLSDGRELSLADIKNGCYRSFDSDMGSKAVKLRKTFTWEDIVLPEQSRRLLSDACTQVRLRRRVLEDWGFSEKLPYGRGVSMIFTGPPGTGKTMGAQVMASELGMDIYKISLANVVSKYIGDTEKNLNEIFEKARLCRAILFFDEADVLFSKRTEVKDANDKYSNMESAFLLQKTEEYSGVVILATNLVQNFDEAFKRRMRFIIEFPFPDAQSRRLMWEKAFPKSAPLDSIDFDFLVDKFSLSGSNIRNIALHSAFLAAEENSSICMRHVMEAVRNEYAKSGKAFTRAEAGEYFCELT